MPDERGIDIARLMLWEERCTKYGRDFFTAVTYARNRMMPKLNPHDRLQVRELIGLLETARRLLQLAEKGCVKLRPSDRFDRLSDIQCKYINVGIWAVGALAVYDGDQAWLKEFTGRALGNPRLWQTLSKALVENHLRGWSDWRDAEDPYAWIKKVSHDIARQEAALDAPLRFGDGPAIPLDEVLIPAQSPTDVNRIDAAIDALLRDASPDVKAYGALFLQGFTHEEVRRRLGWLRKRAHRAAVAYRRHLKRARSSSANSKALRQEIDGMLHGDANRTVTRVTFRDNDKGRLHTYYEHRKPRP